MPLRKKPIEKMYFSPKEVAEAVGEDLHTLYYWEETFDLEIARGRGGHRRYTKRDLELLNLIHSLIRERKYTTEGVKQYLQYPDKERNRQKVLINLRTSLHEVEEMLKAMNAYKLAHGKVTTEDREDLFE